jgi:nitronate monooxygenase
LRTVFRTALCDVLDIEYPIIQSGMGGVAGPELVGEVCRAGGLGVLAGLNLPGDELRRRIRQVRDLTDRPFGVNLWLHTELRPPTDPLTLPDHTVRAVQGALNVFRQRLGVPTTTERPDPVPDLIDEAIEVVLDERVPVLSLALGLPDVALARRCLGRGVKILAMVATVRDARLAAANGADVIVARRREPSPPRPRP